VEQSKKRNGLRSFFINLLLICFAISITFFLAETLFRKALLSNSDSFRALKNPDVYADLIRHEQGDFYNEDYWKLNYIFNHQEGDGLSDTLLGWTGDFGGAERVHKREIELQGRRPVLFYGDSFTECVDTVACFEDWLNSDTVFSRGHFMLNYGTGGYGTDQIYLAMSTTAKCFNDPFVLVGILTTDLDRSMLQFRDAQKPYFELANNKLLLRGTPVPTNIGEYVSENPPKITSYLFNRLKNTRLWRGYKEDPRANDFIQRTKELNTAILNQLFDELEIITQSYAVVVFHPEHHVFNDWRLRYLREFLIGREIPYVCGLDLRVRDTTFLEYNTNNYVIENNGHPTSHMNKLLANEIRGLILSDSFRKTKTPKKSELKMAHRPDEMNLKIWGIRRSHEQLTRLKDSALQNGKGVVYELEKEALRQLEKGNEAGSN
jgi:hypothetical protein